MIHLKKGENTLKIANNSIKSGLKPTKIELKDITTNSILYLDITDSGTTDTTIKGVFEFSYPNNSNFEYKILNDSDVLSLGLASYKNNENDKTNFNIIGTVSTSYTIIEK